MRRWTSVFSRMPIKIKLTLGSAVLLALLFAGYNALQYLIMEKWIINREKDAAHRSMNGILNYFLERESGFTADELPDIRHYLEKVNRDDQRIRIIDASGVPILTVTDQLSETWLEPVSSAHEQLAIARDNEHSALILRSPLTIFEFEGTVEIVKSMDEFEELTAAISKVMYLFAIAAVGLSVLVGWLLSWRLLKPLQAMALTLRGVRDKGLQERMVPASNGDEIATLMHLFNEMMDKVEESFRQQSRFVEDASHELRTPIAIIEGHLGLLQRWGKENPEVLEESLEASQQEFARLKGLVQELLALSRAEKMTLVQDSAPMRPKDEIQAIVKRVALIFPAFKLLTDLEAVSNARLAMSGAHLEQILLIVLDNAVKYSYRSNEILIGADLRDDRVHIHVTDYGIGIPAKDLPLVTNRFYRVDKARSRELGGNGLGLAIAMRLVERYQGTLAIRSQESVGTTVTIILPLLPNDA
ncbi:sensor histidine kinase [Cohnella faecalis]|uniref:Signal transduction histidine-protein kinase ArlS n=1 Tax=Cohnella faecalis TaxID=2315694 RepID=A0A398CKL7_9BACL|nr:HAMP domain-containing histidine kinase [Cohnella faecalis]RIE00437.1 sensor histidine kinase [Cohnella faecalis]